MLTRIRRLLRYAVGTRYIDIDHTSATRLELRCGATKTIFDKESARVLQNSRLVGTFGVIDRIELHQPRDQEGPENWFVTLQLEGRRQVEVGKVTDQTDASLVGARISTITGRPVVVKR